MVETATVPIEKKVIDREKDIEIWLQFFRTRTFVFNYRNRYRVSTANVLAKDLETAREKAEIYCERFQLRFISVHPFYLDLDRTPEREGEGS